jgi:hypothetical protein
MVLLGAYWYECNVTTENITDILHYRGEVIFPSYKLLVLTCIEVTCPPISSLCPARDYEDDWPQIMAVDPPEGACQTEIHVSGLFTQGYNYTITLDNNFATPCEVTNVSLSEVDTLLLL